MSFLSGLGKKLDKGLSSVVHSGEKFVAGYQSGQVLSQFSPNNIVQLVSCSSGRALQIVQSPSGQLVVDTLGLTGAAAGGQYSPNTCWSVVAYGKNSISLHNNNNYLAIFNGAPCVRYYPAQPGAETKFLLYENKHNTISLESTSENGRYIAFSSSGAPLSGTESKRSELSSQFNVTLVTRSFSVAGPQPGPGVVPTGMAGPPVQPQAGYAPGYAGDPRAAAGYQPPPAYQPPPQPYPGVAPASYAGGPPPAGIPGGTPGYPSGPPASYPSGAPPAGAYAPPSGYAAPPVEGGYPPPSGGCSTAGVYPSAPPPK